VVPATPLSPATCVYTNAQHVSCLLEGWMATSWRLWFVLGGVCGGCGWALADWNGHTHVPMGADWDMGLTLDAVVEAPPVQSNARLLDTLQRSLAVHSGEDEVCVQPRLRSEMRLRDIAAHIVRLSQG
jgi:hypothetical protein